MSLINQVLKDLEHRQHDQMPDTTVLLKNVRYTPTEGVKSIKSRRQLKLVATAIAGIGVLSVGIWYGYSRLVNNTPKVQVATATPSMTTAAAPVVPIPIGTPATPIAIQNPPSIAQPSAALQSSEVSTQEQLDTPPPKSATKAVITKREHQRTVVQQTAVNYDTAYELVRQGRSSEAERLLRVALIQNPELTRLRELLLGIYINAGRWVEADELLTEGLRVNPSHLAFIKLRVRTLMQLNEDKRAIQLLRANQSIVDQDIDTQALLAALYQRQQQHSEAAALYQQMLQRNPNHGVWWVGLGISLEAIGKQADAQIAYQQARKIGNLNQAVTRYTDNRLRSLEELELGQH